MSIKEFAGKPFKFISSLAALLALAGCANVAPETAQVVQQPSTAPVRNITSFNGALKCMDNLFLSHGVRDVYITSAGIPDATGAVRAGTREMMISAISRMSVKSNAFRYVDYDPNQVDVHLLHELIDSSSAFFAPNYYIRGAITQFDRNVIQSQQGFGFSFAGDDVDLDLGVDRNKVIQIVALDMNVADFVSRQIVSGLSSATSIAIVGTGRGGDAGGRIKKAGIFFNVSLDKNEGLAQAVRTLVELATIEVLGKLSQVPYWKCLQIESTNPEVSRQAADWYHELSAPERVTFVQRALKGSGYYNGPVDGIVNAETTAAINAYQVENDLVADGRVGFPVYMALLGTGKGIARVPPAADERIASVPAEAQRIPQRQAPNLTLLSDRGARPAYRVSETLALSVIASRNSYLYCYYRDSQDIIARIYPNRYQPDAYVQGNKSLRIPHPTAPFSIRFDTPGASEEVVCLASDRELTLHLPKQLQAADLEPLPVTSMNNLVQMFREIDKTGLAVARLPITVK